MSSKVIFMEKKIKTQHIIVDNYFNGSNWEKIVKNTYYCVQN